MKTTSEFLKAHGVDVGRGTIHVLDPADITQVHDKASPWYDPRIEHPIDPECDVYQSILTEGVRDPIALVRGGLDKTGKPIIYIGDGLQRIRMSIHINDRRARGEIDGDQLRLRAIFIHGTPKEIKLRNLASNLQRLHETPYTKAVKIGQLLKMGASYEEIARACNTKTMGWIDEHLLILNFAPEVQQAFNGELPATAIRAFAEVPFEEQAQALEGARTSGAKHTRHVRAAVRAARNGEQYTPPVKREKLWPRARIEKLAERVSKAKENLDQSAIEAGAEVTTLRDKKMERAFVAAGALAMVKLLLGDRSALDAWPDLRELVTEVKS